jgi:hypothetical protein
MVGIFYLTDGLSQKKIQYEAAISEPQISLIEGKRLNISLRKSEF